MTFTLKLLGIKIDHKLTPSLCLTYIYVSTNKALICVWRIYTSGVFFTRATVLPMNMLLNEFGWVVKLKKIIEFPLSGSFYEIYLSKKEKMNKYFV